MPTPVNTARESLTEEAARALDDAVAVARRRSHAQTTSLHVISALLTMPSSILREICISRASHNIPYSSRLQFRALELCVGVSLDRLSSSKSTAGMETDPPVSNSLMAAIKRSQANQRRHPETYHLQQIHHSSQTTTVLKVELKYFILSILDDPIVNRVFGEAGFRSLDIKHEVLHPPRARYPPLFMCNLPSLDPLPNENYSRRICEVLGYKERKNPLLVGTNAVEALKTFTDSVNSGKLGFMVPELSVVSIEKEISEVLGDGSKLDELVRVGNGRVLVNLGDLKVLLTSGESVEDLVLKVTDLVKRRSEKVWLIGCVASDDTYKKLCDRFPTIEKDWDLHLILITSVKPAGQGVYPKSSLMGSFVPFGGFFSSTSDFRVPLSGIKNQTLSFSRCKLCNEKYLQEVAAVVKAGSSLSLADQCSNKLPSWLRAAETELDKGTTGSSKAIGDSNALASQTAALQKKWDNICQDSAHQTPTFPKVRFQSMSPQFRVQTGKNGRSSTEQTSPGFHSRTPESYLETCKLSNPAISKPKLVEDLTTSVTSGMASPPLSCVTTDLGLGVIYAAKSQEESNTRREKPLLMSFSSSSEQKDFKSLRGLLSCKVGWQTEAVNAISQIICECKSDSTRRNSTSGIWLALLGPDKVGKKKIALALSDVFFGGQFDCICVDFGDFYDKFRSKSVVEYITGELSRKPNFASVVLLENVEEGGFVDRLRLSEAVNTGTLCGPNGRGISMKNVIVVATSGIGKDDDQVTEPMKFSEERVLSARNWKLQIKLSNVTKIGVNKRKYEPEIEQRAEKVQRSYLDLNLPVNETEVAIDHETQDTKAWFDNFINQVDGKVTFKPVDFDGLAKNIEENIFSHFKQCFGSDTHLEIDSEVIVQILAASWSSSKEERKVDQWIQTVLVPSFAEARQKYGSNPTFAVRLVASRDLAAEVELPAKVDVM